MEREEYIAKKNEIKKDYELFLTGFMLDEKNVPIVEKSIFPKEKIQYIKVTGINNECRLEIYERLCAVIAVMKIPIINVINICGSRIEIFIGTTSRHLKTLQGLVVQHLSVNVGDEVWKYEDVFHGKYDYCHALVGECKELDNDNSFSALDSVIRTGRVKDVSIVITSVPLHDNTVHNYHEIFTKANSLLDQLLTREVTIRDERESVGFNENDSVLLNFKDIIDRNVKKYKCGMGQGMFGCTIKIYSKYVEDGEQVAGSYMGFLSDTEGRYPLNSFRFKDSIEYNDCALVSLNEVKIGELRFRLPVYSNFYTSAKFAQILSFPYIDTVGYEYRKTPQFEVFREYDEGIHIGEIIRNKICANQYYVPFADLNRHIFVPGMTGAGKTNTIKYILYNLYRNNIPWLVVEPAKAEYYELFKMGVNNLQIISAGSNRNNLLINPFQPINENVPIQEHIDSLYSAFMASFTWVAPLPYVLENALYRLYEKFGFDLSNQEKNKGLKYPTVEALFWIIPEIVDEMNYDGRLRQEIISSLQARISTIRRGTKGNILNVQNSMDFERILNLPVIVELEQVKDNSAKAFIMSLICILLREYRMQQKDVQLGIKHFFLVEEAHRLLKRKSPINSDCSESSADGVEFFTEMLAELRSKGQGFILADQIPEHLVDDVIKNTNLKIVHRLASRQDATLVGETMNCDDEQIKYMSVLRRGEAIVYSEGDLFPKLVNIPYVNDYVKSELECLNRKEILEKCGIVQQFSIQNLYNTNPVDILFDVITECEECEKVVGIINRFSESLADLRSLKEVISKMEDIMIELIENRQGHYIGFALKKIMNSLDVVLFEKYQILFELMDLFHKNINNLRNGVISC